MDAFPLQQACPKCLGAFVRDLGGISQTSSVWYYRCGGCGHVWNVPKPTGAALAELRPEPARPGRGRRKRAS